MTKIKKPFWETKVGKVVSSLSGILPKEGVLGVVRGILDGDDSLTPEEKESALNEALEAYKLEVSDRDSARKRESAVRKYGTDWMMSIAGLIGLAVFVFLVYTVVTVDVPESNREIFIHMIGIVEGIILSIYGFYYGSAMKSNK